MIIYKHRENIKFFLYGFNNCKESVAKSKTFLHDFLIRGVVIFFILEPPQDKT